MSIELRRAGGRHLQADVFENNAVVGAGTAFPHDQFTFERAWTERRSWFASRLR
jgi:hypothetical protein